MCYELEGEANAPEVASRDAAADNYPCLSLQRVCKLQLDWKSQNNTSCSTVFVLLDVALTISDSGRIRFPDQGLGVRGLGYHATGGDSAMRSRMCSGFFWKRSRWDSVLIATVAIEDVDNLN